MCVCVSECVCVYERQWKFLGQTQKEIIALIFIINY